MGWSCADTSHREQPPRAVGHAGARMCALAWDVPCDGWVSTVRELLHDSSLSDVLSYSGFTTDVFHAIKSCKKHSCGNVGNQLILDIFAEIFFLCAHKNIPAKMSEIN